ncbi:membrane protein insertase YidC [Corynebacterium mendelii]|uniref:Membrane protein insertase YidC n=1 Tax=Corynebacterium mendelii TaxID=2765362 RepID=A0A939DZV0_9CORY|nr:membrane protein insertase YidC [Corynebacterium mendelii]
MLNFVYWPISVVLWFWHKVFSLVLEPTSGISWILAIVLLTFTIRALLVKPMFNQMRSMAKMQEFQPQMAAIKEKYKNDQQKMMEETRKLQKEMGVNPLAGCLPVLVQMPVFIGLFHVLRSFNRTGTGTGQLGLSIEVNRQTANYFFQPEDVQSFLDARFFGVPLSSYISMPQDMYEAFQPVDFTRTNIIIVAVPLIVIIAAATHLNARFSVMRTKRRQAQGLTKAPTSGQMQMQTEMMNKMMLWIFPFSILITGAFWHIGLLFYMMANNIWTYGQQRIMFAKLDREEAEAIARKKEAKRATAPKPGVKPVNTKKGGRKNQQPHPAPTPADDAPAADTGTGSGAADSRQQEQPTGLFGGLKSAWRQMKQEALTQAQAEADRKKKQLEDSASGTSGDTTGDSAADSGDKAANSGDNAPDSSGDTTPAEHKRGTTAASTPQPGARRQGKNKKKNKNKNRSKNNKRNT